MLPVPGMGRNELNGGVLALLCATCRTRHRRCLGEGAAMAVDGGGSAERGHVLGGLGGQEVSPAAAVPLQRRSRHEPHWSGLLLSVRLQAGQKPNFYLLLI